MKKWFGLILTLVLTFALAQAYAADFTYIIEGGGMRTVDESTVKKVAAGTTTFDDGVRYVDSTMTINTRVKLTHNSTLVLVSLLGAMTLRRRTN